MNQDLSINQLLLHASFVVQHRTGQTDAIAAVLLPGVQTQPLALRPAQQINVQIQIRKRPLIWLGARHDAIGGIDHAH